jgi:hypothetical protein
MQSIDGGISVKIIPQLSILLENKPGTLAAVCESLAENKVNIYGLSVSDAIDHAVVRMLVTHPKKAIHLLGERGVLVFERDVLLIEAKSQPGELAAIAQKLSENKINIEYVYTATAPSARKGVIVLSVDNIKRASRILDKY